MHRIVLYSIVLRRSQLYCIVNLLLCGYNTIQCFAQICRSIGQASLHTAMIKTELGLRFDYRKAVQKHHGTMTSSIRMNYLQWDILCLFKIPRA